MLPVTVIATLLSVGLCLLFLACGSRWAIELGPNMGFGIKTRATKSSAEAWRRGHEAARPVLMISSLTGLVLAAAAGVLLAIESEVAIYLAIGNVVFLIAALIVTSFIADSSAKAES